MHQFWSYGGVSVTVAAFLTAIAPLVASWRKAAQVRRRFQFESGDEIRLVRGDSTETLRAQSDTERVQTVAKAENEVILSEEESTGIMSGSQAFAATSIGELKVLKPESRAARGVLTGFVVILLVFGIVNVIFYWKQIRTNGNLVLWGLGLMIAMVAGMFVQVLSANYRSGNPLFSVGASELIFPLLFSPIVFYPVWALTGNGSQNLFSYYAAFLNGYFWQSVVSAARVPARE